jgi:hypothetical protein
VQDEIFGMPAIVGDAQDPAAAATGPLAAPEDDDAEEEDEDVDELDDDPVVEAAVVDEGDVGDRALLVLL